MGAGASDTGKENEKLKDPPRPRNYVPICDPPQYDLTFDSTDSEITELQEEYRKLRKHQIPAKKPDVPSHPEVLKEKEHPVPHPHPAPVPHPQPQRISHPHSISIQSRNSFSENLIGELQPERSSEQIHETHEIHEELTVGENIEEQITVGRYEEEQTAFPETNSEDIKFRHFEEIPEPSEAPIEAETEVLPTITVEETRKSSESRELNEDLPRKIPSKITPQPSQKISPQISQKISPPEIKEKITCKLNSVCTREDICRLRRCQRQVSFADHKPTNHFKRTSNCSSPYDEVDDYPDSSTYDGFVHCSCLTTYPTDDSDQEEAEAEEEEVEEEDEEEVMPDYQHYSREQPEKDPNGRKAPERENMRDCCRPCCPNRTVSLKHNNLQQQDQRRLEATSGCRCPQGCTHTHNTRHASESYVSCRAKNPSHSKSVPNNQLEERDSYSNFPGAGGRPLPPTRRSPSRHHSSTAKRNKPRTYPPGAHFEVRGDQERPHIPLPPPPEHFASDQPQVPPRNHQSREARALGSREQRDSRDIREVRAQTSDSRESQDHLEEHHRRKEMYGQNTNRNYVNKKPYGSHPYNHPPPPNHRQAIKPYPYEEPSGSTSYSHESTCSNNCSGYDPCPMHQSCRCQCHCVDHYCPQGNGGGPQSDDQMSYCSDSSNSECMNLAYQRTGDYPELMDELENTLSYRNRMRVQKTMQRFEMLSRQNKNLEKPIFEDDESVRHFNMANGEKHDGQDCKCRHCEDKQRRQNYSRNEALAKRPNYQPTPFPRNSGYVEKVARYMDPNLNNRRDGNPRKKLEERHSHEMPTTLTNSNGTWQMDSRKNEWVKVDGAHAANQNHYDFENSYPPLPPRPGSDQMYDRRNYQQERAHCSCTKCLRRR